MKCKLADICTKIGSGATPHGGKEAYCDKGISLVRSQNILDFTFSNDGLVFINDEQAAKLNNVEVFDEDVLLNITGDSVARACMINSAFLPARVNQHVAIVRGKKDCVLNRYLLYFLQWKKEYLLQLASAGATRNALTKGMIEQLEIDLPSIDKQKKIVALLGGLDDKIEVNNKINENLEQQAQAIYQEWFGNINMEKKQGMLSDICTYSKDRVSVSELDISTYFSTENMLPGKAGAVEASNLPTTAQTTACHVGDTLISNIRPYFKKIVCCYEECGCSTDVLCFVPVHPKYSAYLYSTLYADRFFDFMVAGSKGTKMPRGDKQQIMTYPVTIPTDNELEEFNSVAIPILAKIQNNRNENKRLSALRDAVLPKLMNGEIDVNGI
jgi:type I restriction enzyme S subunit